MSRNIQVPIKSTSGLEVFRDTKEGKLIFTSLKGNKMAFLIQKNRLIAARVLPTGGQESEVGAIYIGKVQNFSSNINAFFVEIGQGKMCFLSAKELCPGQKLKGGDELPVQIIREAQKTKLPTASAKISLSNDYAVISLGSPKTGYSKQLPEPRKKEIAGWLREAGVIDKDGKFQNNFRDELRDMAQDKLPNGLQDESQRRLQNKSQDGVQDSSQGNTMPQMGIIVRTQAGECEKDTFLTAVQSLIMEFTQLLQTAPHRSCFSCIRHAPSACETVLDDMARPHEYQEIVTDDREIYDELGSILSLTTNLRAQSKAVIRFYEDNVFSLVKLYSLESKLDTALERCVWLKSGAYLVIEATEALTVIDVNSGKFEASRHKAAAEMILEVNREAAEEVALQLRLRNLSGIIIVDFINMAQEEHERELLEYLTRLVKADRQLTKVVDITPLGLVELTRKKSSKILAEQLVKYRNS